MNIIRRWREKNWQEVDASIYSEAYSSFGGSVITHPHIIQTISDITEMSLRFLARYHEDKLVAAIPVWGSSIAGSKKALKKARKNRILDFGNPEVILPIDCNWTGKLPFQSDFVSHLHSNNIRNLKPSSAGSVSLARSYKSTDNGLSKKFKYNKRRELRLLEENGGLVLPVSQLSISEFSQTYTRLFQTRWGFEIKGTENLERFLGQLKEHLSGYFIVFDNMPVAIQLLLKTESPKWISVEYINGGVDPAFNEHSPGSVLSYLHTSQMETLAESHSKSLRFSFGQSDTEYKDRWCYRSPVYQL